ncbi:MAG: copper amine oxidase N-terminal domain-containing protein, partial [Clostridia bacterium]|nr:copper amine oxidase N-terminal domain-containing protein [Clostridia bacterium]
KQMDGAPYIVNGSPLIPLRGLLEEMGATVSWDGETQTVTVEKGLLKLELQIWSKMVYAETAAYGRVRHTMLNFPVIKDSRTFIPIRFISEQLGYNVSWDGETRTVTITTPEI